MEAESTGIPGPGYIRKFFASRVTTSRLLSCRGFLAVEVSLFCEILAFSCSCQRLHILGLFKITAAIAVPDSCFFGTRLLLIVVALSLTLHISFSGRQAGDLLEVES